MHGFGWDQTLIYIRQKICRQESSPNGQKGQRHLSKTKTKTKEGQRHLSFHEVGNKFLHGTALLLQLNFINSPSTFYDEKPWRQIPGARTSEKMQKKEGECKLQRLRKKDIYWMANAKSLLALLTMEDICVWNAALEQDLRVAFILSWLSFCF